MCSIRKENFFTLIKEILFKFKKEILIVFGCGGDRDRKKRSVMGTVTASCLDPEKDSIYVTSDNPRTEDPLKIMDDILDGLQGFPRVHSIVDRKEAIFKALSLMEKNGVLLIAGKGHEDYQILGKKRIYFDDREEAMKVLRRRLNLRKV